jgi:hypothetical protein
LNERPGSFYELELLLRCNPDKNVDQAVHASLVRHSFAETFFEKTEATLDIKEVSEAIQSTIARAAKGTMTDEELKEHLIQRKQIITQLADDYTHRQVEYASYKQRALQHQLQTFKYLGELQGKLIPLSKQALDLSEEEFAALTKIAVSRGLNLDFLR